MMIDHRRLIASLIAGVLSAVVVDVHAWSRSEAPFDWRLAAKRWVAGAVSGLAAAFGAEVAA